MRRACANGSEAPKTELEQYATSAHLAAALIHTAAGQDDIDGCRVLDLGCGAGILSIGAALLGGIVTSVDVDGDALELAAENADRAEVEIDLVYADVRKLPLRARSVDTVVMNPPFGTKLRGIDMLFLEAACDAARSTVYSLHKTSTRTHVGRAGTALGFPGRVIAEMRFNLPKTMRMHKRASVDVAVDVWRFERGQVT